MRSLQQKTLVELSEKDTLSVKESQRGIMFLVMIPPLSARQSSGKVEYSVSE